MCLSKSIKPHGGELIQRELKESARESYLQKITKLPEILISTWSISDIELISNGGFSPLTGFMGKRD